MRNKVEVRANFSSFGYAELIMKASEVNELAKRDSNQFNSNGFSERRRQKFEEMIFGLNKIPSDLRMEAKKIKATRLKNQISTELRSDLRKIIVFAKSIYGDKFEKATYSTIAPSKMNDKDLFFYAEEVLKFMSENIVDFADLELSQDYCEQINAKVADFKAKYLDMRNKVHSRNETTDLRWKKAKEVYNEMLLYCEMGKIIWEYENEALFNDYCIKSKYMIYKKEAVQSPTTNADSNNG